LLRYQVILVGFRASLLESSKHDFCLQLPHQSYLCSNLLQLCHFASVFQAAATQKMTGGVMGCVLSFL